jgi:DNA-directed RNA polymerase subunit RPC12/RpoP
MRDRDDMDKAIERERERLKDAPRPAHHEKRDGRLEDAKPIVEGPVTDKDREGVYVHSFKCLRCALHFMVFSWRADRHTIRTVICPECGQREGLFGHWRATLSERKEFQYPLRRAIRFDHTQEIYQAHDWPGSVLLDDTRLPPKREGTP